MRCTYYNLKNEPENSFAKKYGNFRKKILITFEKIPERSKEEIKELLANWKGTLVVVDDISISPWISVEDKLPEPEKEVIILNKRKQIDIDFLTDDFEGGYYWWKSDDIICCEDDEITHWMPIPELPKEERK